MNKTTMQALLVFLYFTSVIESVKIGISKPITISENVTTETTEGTTLEPTTITAKTTVKITTSTTPKKIQTTKPPTKPTTKATSTSTIISTTSTTTTPIPSTSTTLPATSSKNDSEQISPLRKINIDRTGYFCSCDLRHAFCDINCCCDIDCISDELNSFDCHEEDRRLEDFNYMQGLPPCRINEGWLCVIRTNEDSSKNRKRKYILDSASFHEWPQLLAEDIDLTRDRNYYKIGDPVLLYNLEENEIIDFDLPFSLIGHNCEIHETVRYLQSKKSTCHLPLEKAKSLEIVLLQRLCTSFLLQGPNLRIPADGIITEKLTEFIPITMFRCTKVFDCVPISINNSFFEYSDDSDHSHLIQMRLTHNITNFLSCEVYFVESDERSNDVWLDYEVEFLHINETFRNSVNVSGPLGYNVGSPIIISQKVLFNESADQVESNRILSYFHPNRSQSIHIFVPRRKQGQCENSQLTMNFGENILVQCSVQLNNSTEITSDTNFTKICADLQDHSFDYLQVSEILELEQDFFISILGYPANKTEFWTKIELRNYEHLPVLGVYLAKEDSFICQNMILGIKYEFLTIRKEVDGVQHQHMLYRGAIEVGRRHDLQFQLDEIVSIPVTFSTMFHELQEPNEASKQSSSVYLSLLILIFLGTHYLSNK